MNIGAYLIGGILILAGLFLVSSLIDQRDLQNILPDILNAKTNILLVSLIILSIGIGIIVKLIRVRL